MEAHGGTVCGVGGNEGDNGAVWVQEAGWVLVVSCLTRGRFAQFHAQHRVSASGRGYGGGGGDCCGGGRTSCGERRVVTEDPGTVARCLAGQGSGRGGTGKYGKVTG